MILRSYALGLVPVAVMLAGFGLGATRAIAQTTYPISAYYDTLIQVMPITPDVSQVLESADSTDAPYGLNQYSGLTYARTNFTTGELTFSIDPTTFGLQGYPTGNIVFGNGTNKLFGTADAATKIDFENFTASGSGTLNITGGEGIFQNASGTLLFTENDIISPEEPNILRGLALVSGSIQTLQTVPEPRSTTPLIGMGVIGAGLLLRRRLKS